MIINEAALKQLQKYCAYQDRCHQEVRHKLLSLGVYGMELEEIILALMEEDFLNEERFARSFVRGKFKLKRWGRRKIELELKKRNISAYCIKKGMEEIEEQDYLFTLENLVEKKAAEYKYQQLDEFPRKQKLATYLINRGYESPLVWSVLNRLI